MSTINSIPFRSTIFYRTDGTIAPIGTVFTISTNGLLNFSNNISLNTLNASSILSFSTLSGSTMLTTGNVGIGTTNPYSALHVYGSSTDKIIGLITNANTAVGSSACLQYGLWPLSGSSQTGTNSPSAEIRAIALNASNGNTDLAFSVYTGVSTTPNYTLVERMRITAAGNVGIGTTVPQAPLHVYNALGVSLSNTNTVNYTQSAILGFNFGGGILTGTRDSFRILSQTVNRDNGAGPTFFDYGAQADLIFQRKTNNLYSGGANDMTYTEVMRLGGATGNVGIGTEAPIYRLQIEQGLSNNSNGLFISNTNYGSMQGLNISMVNAGSGNFNSYAALQGFRSGVAASSTPICLQPSSGNVGIGGTNPMYKTQIVLASNSDPGTSNVFGLTTADSSAQSQRLYMGLVDNGGTGTNSYSWISASRFGNAYNTLALQPLGGNVGIGTNSPAAYALDVVGEPRFGYATGNDFLVNLGRAGVGGGRSAYIYGNSNNMEINNQQAGALILSTNNAERIRIASNGNVGIGSGTTYAGSRMNVVSAGTGTDASGWIAANFGGTGVNPRVVIGCINGSATVAAHTDNLGAWADLVLASGGGNVGIGRAPGAFQLHLSADSAAKASTSTWSISSDERLKENIVLADVDRCVEIIRSVPLKHYRWKDEVYTLDQVKDRSKLGWIAQDVEKIFPKAVGTHVFRYNQVYEDVVKEDGTTEKRLVSEDVIEDCRDLNADQLYAVMYGAIQKLISENDLYKTTNIAINEQFAALQARMDALEARLAA